VVANLGEWSIIIPSRALGNPAGAHFYDAVPPWGLA
jgi:hypothetical protein